MGREVKRVALDFDWPLNKVWRGYLNPFCALASKCEECDGSGSNREGRFLVDLWYAHNAQEMFGAFFGSNILAVWDRQRLKRAGWSDEVCDNIEMAKRFGFKTLTQWSDKLEQEDVDALIEAGRLMELTHTWDPTKGWQPRKPQPKITPEDVARWSASGLGHDGINQWVCVKARAKRYGVKSTRCLACKGEGEVWPNAEDKKKCEAWKDEEPPAGDGWQMWETTTEGSPISPVKESAEALARWLADNNASAFGDDRATYDQWLGMIKKGWAPSAVAGGGKGFRSGVEAVSES